MSKITVINILLFVACSKTNIDDKEYSNNITTDITVIGTKNNVTYQANIDNGSTTKYHNLTEELGLFTYNFVIARNFQPYINFYKYSSYPQSYSVWEKNLDTEANFNLDIFCQLDAEEARIFPYNSENYLLIFTAEYNGNNPFIYVRIYNKSTANCTKLRIGIADTGEPRGILIQDDVLVYCYVGGDYKYKIVKINLNNSTIEGELSFDQPISATIGNNKLYVFNRGNTPVNEIYIYSLNNYDLIETKSVNFYSDYLVGLFSTQFKGDQMINYLPYAQPSPISSYPLIFDLVTNQEVKHCDLYKVKANLEALYTKTSVSLLPPNTVDLTSELIIGVYKISENSGISYGIYYANFKSEIISNVEIDMDNILGLIIR